MDKSEQGSRFREWHREHQGIILRIARASAFNLAATVSSNCDYKGDVYFSHIY
jgi:hypothetical protein